MRLPDGIVDVFESVQIKEWHCGMALVAMCEEIASANSIVQEHPIRQPGQKVVLRRIS